MGSWLWDPGRAPGCWILAVRSWLSTPGCGILAVRSWMWLLAVISWLSAPGCGLPAVGSWQWDPGCGSLGALLAVGSWLWPSQEAPGTKNIEKPEVFIDFWVAHRAEVVKTMCFLMFLRHMCQKPMIFLCFFERPRNRREWVPSTAPLTNPPEPLHCKHCLGNDPRAHVSRGASIV